MVPSKSGTIASVAFGEQILRSIYYIAVAVTDFLASHPARNLESVHHRTPTHKDLLSHRRQHPHQSRSMESMTPSTEERQFKDWEVETSRRLAVYKTAVEAYDEAIHKISVLNVQNDMSAKNGLYLAAVLPYLEKIRACDKVISEPKSQLERSLADRGLLFSDEPPSYADATHSQSQFPEYVKGEYLRLTLQEASSRQKWQRSKRSWEFLLRQSMCHDDDKEYAKKEWSEVIVPYILHCLGVPYFHLCLHPGNRVKAETTFEWQKLGDLSFSSGQEIDVVAAVDNDWLVGRYTVTTGSIQVVKVGIFPRNHIGYIEGCRYNNKRSIPERWKAAAAKQTSVREVPTPLPNACSLCNRLD